MKLSLSEAATVLGKSERQIRYLIKRGEVRASKQDGKWSIQAEDLPLNDAQRAALGERVEAAREAFDKGLAPAEKAAAPQSRGAYSVTQLAAFEAGREIYRELVAGLGHEHVAAQELFRALAALARGCHAFQSSAKAARYVEAREAAATAAAHLWVLPEAHALGSAEFGRRIEQELIPKIARLVATHERRVDKARFDRFGSALVPGRFAAEA
jgi:hypothetical protein